MYHVATGVNQLTDKDLQHIFTIIGAVGLVAFTFIILVIGIRYFTKLFVQ